MPGNESAKQIRNRNLSSSLVSTRCLQSKPGNISAQPPLMASFGHSDLVFNLQTSLKWCAAVSFARLSLIPRW